MKHLKLSFKGLMTLCCAFGLMFFISSCEDDDSTTVTNACEGVTCPNGQTCDNGVCLADCGGTAAACEDGEFCLFDVCIACDADHIVKTGFITTNETWTADNIYVLSNKVIVNDGVTLTIEPGTIVKGAPGLGNIASALVVARGGMINARGTASNPITFTALSDNICVGELQGTNLTTEDRGLWGGLIILGNAPISAPAPNETEAQIEGIPANESYNFYGGNDANDNSGVLSYVSVRHGGIDLADGDEINGITFGGVGRGTELNHIEVVANLDDGVEFFGGSANASEVVIINQGDDAVDVDQAYSGTIENFVVRMGGGVGDEALELDGPEGDANNGGRYTITDGTIIATEDNHSAGDLKSRSQGTIMRCSFQGFLDDQHFKVRASFREEGGNCVSSGDAYTNLIDGSLTLSDNEAVSSTAAAANFLRVYPDGDDACNGLTDADQTAADNEVVAGGNQVVQSASSSRGATLTDFDTWSFGRRNNLF